MTHQEHLQRHLDLCKAVYEHLKRTGDWSYPDSTISEDVIESHGNSKVP